MLQWIYQKLGGVHTFQFMLKRYRKYILPLLALASAPAFANIEPDETKEVDKFYDELQKDRDVAKKPYRSGIYSYIPTLEYDTLSNLTVKRGKRTVFSETSSASDNQRWLVHPITNATDKSMRLKLDRSLYNVVGSKYKRSQNPFVDINGDGQAEIILEEWSGGAHCCYTYKVYSLDRKNHLWGSIVARDGTFAFADIDGDNKVEAIGPDFTFAYWNTSFAGSPAGVVILRPSRTQFTVALDLMRTPKPSDKELNALIEKTKKEIAEYNKDFKSNDGTGFSLSSELWSRMIDLIYTGHANEAWELCRKAWPAGKTALICNDQTKNNDCAAGGPNEFIDVFLAKLKTSPYWNGLKALNSGDKLMNRGSSKKKEQARKKVIMEAGEVCDSKKKK